MKRPENSARFPASYLPHPFPSKPRERRRTRSYKKPSQERSEEEEEEKGAGKERGQDGAGGSPGLCVLLLRWVKGHRGRAVWEPALCVFRAHLVAGATSRDTPEAWGEGSPQDSGAVVPTLSVVTSDRWAPEILQNSPKSFKV